MQTLVTRRGQTVIPASLRAKYNIRDGDRLAWIDDGQSIKVVPVPADPIKALRGAGKGENLTAKLLESRRRDREKES